MSPDLIRRRPIPLIGRSEDTQLLWSTLGTVLERGRMQVLILEGASGNGCSHLASWLCEEAHRVGAATPLLGLDTPEPGGPAGLLSALRSRLRLHDLSPQEQESRLRAQLGLLTRPSGREIWTLLAMLVDPHSSQMRFNAAQSDALYRLCLSLCRGPGPERPLILHLDEAQWARPTIDLLRDWVGRQGLRPLPMLVLLVNRTQARQLRPDASRSLARLERHTEVRRTLVGPLDAGAIGTLFNEVLGLDEALSQELIEHSQGNPAYAIELVRQWIEAGELLGGPHGLKRRDPLAPVRIQSPRQTWIKRVKGLLHGLDRTNRLCIEVAAALGLGVNTREWSQACISAGHSPSPGLRSELIRRGIWSSGEISGMVRFSHPMLQACILHMAQAAGRLGAHHLACAQALRDRPLNPVSRNRALSRHLLSSGQPRAALPYLRLSASSMLQRADLPGTRRQLRCHAAVMEICPEDLIEEQIESDLLRARAALLEGKSTRSRQLLKWSIGSAVEGSHPVQELRSRLAMGCLELRAGRPLAGWKQALLCTPLLEEAMDRELHAQQRVLMGRICLLSGRLSKALVHFAEATAFWAEMEDPKEALRGSFYLAELALFRGQIDLAAGHLRIAADCSRARMDPLEAGRIELLSIQLDFLRGPVSRSRNRLRRSLSRGLFQVGDLGVESQLMSILLQIEASELPSMESLSTLRAQIESRGLGRLRPTLAALELLYRMNKRDEKGISQALDDLLGARRQTGLWNPRDQQLVQRMIDTHRTSAAIPLGLVSHLESCLELRPPHFRRPLGLGKHR